MFFKRSETNSDSRTKLYFFIKSNFLSTINKFHIELKKNLLKCIIVTQNLKL